jgi:arginyl-tRNA synthetase
MMLEELKQKFSEAFQDFEIPIEQEKLEFTVPEKQEFGDLSLNLAMKLAKRLKQNPRSVAVKIIDHLRQSSLNIFFADIQIAGAGFINFFYSDPVFENSVHEILSKKENYGRNQSFDKKSVLIEFVSANPTGPLTIAHGRQAVVGDCLARIMTFCGANVKKEYYLNDRGVQITTLGKSVFLRYLELFGKENLFPEDCYQGAYIKEIAQHIFMRDADKHMHLSIEEGAKVFRDEAADSILTTIRNDLTDSRVVFDSYFSEKSLLQDNQVSELLALLKERGHSYEKDRALWFETTKFGDDKDRVLIKSDGEYTYLTTDILYHFDKLKRGNDLLIDIFGPDHHGYIARLKASVAALGHDPEKLKVLILQLTTLFEGKTQIHMSTRRGTFVSVRELLDEVGVDATRYFLARKKTDAHLDFDLELAKKQTPDNPVFYVQYAGARIASIFKKASGIPWENISFDVKKIGPAEKEIIKMLITFPEKIALAALELEPQKIAQYLEDIAGMFQRYYSAGGRILTEDSAMTAQKLYLCRAVQQVIQNGLALLGITIPERM